MKQAHILERKKLHFLNIHLTYFTYEYRLEFQSLQLFWAWVPSWPPSWQLSFHHVVYATCRCSCVQFQEIFLCILQPEYLPHVVLPHQILPFSCFVNFYRPMRIEISIESSYIHICMQTSGFVIVQLTKQCLVRISDILII